MNIKELREQAGLTQSELAALVQCDARTIQRYEAAGAKVPAPMLELIRIKLSRCSDPLESGCTNESTAGLYSAPICQDCFDGLWDCKQCGAGIPDQDDHGSIEYCPDCAKQFKGGE